jgi:hypothetical protein
MTGYKRLKRGYRPLADRLQEQLDFTAGHFSFLISQIDEKWIQN